MAKDNTASKRSAEKIARANVLLRAFGDLLPKLERAYGEPTCDAAEARKQHIVALLAVANFLEQTKPDKVRVADQFATLAQALQDVNEGIRATILVPAVANRGDVTIIWLARAQVALAIKVLCFCDHSRKSAAKWAAERYPGLKQLITEKASRHSVDEEKHRSGDIETAMVSWCRDFSRGKVKNRAATRLYSEGLSRLEAWAPPNRNNDQREKEAHRRLQKALYAVSLEPSGE
jgi:hypothetical protein